MKKKYTPPELAITIIDIECSLCNNSSTIKIGNIDEDYLQEWDELPDDTRDIQW